MQDSILSRISTRWSQQRLCRQRMIIVNVHSLNYSTNDWDRCYRIWPSDRHPPFQFSRRAPGLLQTSRGKRPITRYTRLSSPSVLSSFSALAPRPHLTPGVSGLGLAGELSSACLSVCSLVRCRTKYHCKLPNLFSLHQCPTAPISTRIPWRAYRPPLEVCQELP